MINMEGAPETCISQLTFKRYQMSSLNILSPKQPTTSSRTNVATFGLDNRDMVNKTLPNEIRDHISEGDKAYTFIYRFILIVPMHRKELYKEQTRIVRRESNRSPEHFFLQRCSSSSSNEMRKKQNKKRLSDSKGQKSHTLHNPLPQSMTSPPCNKVPRVSTAEKRGVSPLILAYLRRILIYDWQNFFVCQ